MSVELFKHNAETYYNAVNLFSGGIRRVGIVQPTGTGKSFIFLKWIEDNPDHSFVVLSPSVEIFTQLQQYADETGNLSLLDNCQLITYQTLLHKTEQEISLLKADKIIIDEFHRVGADQWGQLVLRLLDANPTAQVLGATATPVRYLDGGKNMAQELFGGRLARYMTLGEAVAQKILPTPVYVPVWYEMDDRLQKYERDIGKITDSPQKHRLEQRLKDLRVRLHNSYGAAEVFRKYMPTDHGKYIVFCSDYEHLVAMKDKLQQWLADVNCNIRCYISISRDTDRDRQLEMFRDDDSIDAIRLLFTIDRLNEGVHIRGVDGVIMLRPTISPIIYLQQIGRALAAGKNSPVIFDLVNNYGNVQVSKEQGECENPFSLELALAFEEENLQDEDTTAYRLFEDVVEFNRLFSNLENILYTDNETRWMQTFDLVREYIRISGRKPSATAVYRDVNIGEWLAEQNRNYKKGSLLPHREQLLRKEGIPLGSQNDIKWYASFELLSQYISQYGQLPPDRTVYKGQNLGKWLCNQKNAFNQGKMEDGRVQLLKTLGVDFEGILDRRWDANLALLKEYIQQSGTLPPKDAVVNGTNLGIWVANQTRLLRQGKLSPHRAQQLEALGVGTQGSNDSRWNTNFEALENCIQQGISLHTHTVDLVRWLKYQKSLFLEGRLSAERRQKLESVGIVFSKNSTYI